MEKWDKNDLGFHHICLVGGVEKQDCGKKILFLFFKEKWKNRKFNLYKFTLIPLLYNT